MSLFPRGGNDHVVVYVDPFGELNAGLWMLFIGATFFLGLRVWCKITRRYGLFYDDYILIASWAILLANDTLIVYEFATGYVLKTSKDTWDDRMHILINVSSCLTPIGQAWSKVAFGVTLLRLSNRWQKWVIWFCIVTLNVFMFVKVLLQWAKVCGVASYQNWYRLDFCIDPTFRDNFKEGGNVYNVIMDFVFAALPWFITQPLKMRKIERIGLCITMSLGILVAIVTAIRIKWEADNRGYLDMYYIWQNAMSLIWYSSEIAGTIIVQCIPILRPILRELHTSFTSKHLFSVAEARSANCEAAAREKRASFSTNESASNIDVEMSRNEFSKESMSVSLDALKPRLSLPPSNTNLPSEFRGPRSGQGMEKDFESISSIEIGRDEVYILDIDSDGEQDSERVLSPRALSPRGLSPPPRRLENTKTRT